MKISRSNGIQLFLNNFSKLQNRKKLNVNQNLIQDKYIHSDTSLMKTYGKNQFNKTRCSDADLDMINFNYISIFKQKGEKVDTIAVGNNEYLKKDLPSVNPNRCNEIKASNNKVVINNGQYYKYQDNSGKTHTFTCTYNKLSQPYSDQLAGRQNNESFNIGKFWNILSTDATYVNSYYSTDEQKQYLSDAGVKEGFFSVQVGKNKQNYFYSPNGKNGVIERQSEYDSTYKMLTKGTALFNKYEVGSVFKFGGKEYVLNEQKRLDIPYGEDIFDFEFPKMEVNV